MSKRKQAVQIKYSILISHSVYIGVDFKQVKDDEFAHCFFFPHMQAISQIHKFLEKHL